MRSGFDSRCGRMTFLDDFENKLLLHFNIHKLKRGLKKIDFPLGLTELYINLYNELFKRIYQFDKVHYEFIDKEKNHLDEAVFYNLILSRLCQINEEVIFLLDKDFFHSIMCLNRMVIETFITALYLSHYPNQIPIFSGGIKSNLKSIPKMLISLKKKEINYLVTSVNERGEIIEKKDILKICEDDWHFFSELVHPTPLSFSPNVFILKDEENIILPYRDSKVKEPKTLMFFLNKPNLLVEEKRSIIVKFLNYSHLTMIELDNFLKKITKTS